MGKLGRCKDLLREFVTGSSVHGIRQTGTAPHIWMQVIWMIIVVAAVVLSCVQVSTLVGRFLARPIEIEKKVRLFSFQLIL